MKHDSKVCLYDIREAGGYILEFTAGMSLEEYCGNALVKAAVERKFAVIGEALVRLRREQAALPENISAAEKIIGFTLARENFSLWIMWELFCRDMLKQVK